MPTTRTTQTLPFAALAYSGGMIPGYTATGKGKAKLEYAYVLDLSSARSLPLPLKLNFDHNPKAPIGQLTSLHNDGLRLFVRGELSAEHLWAEEIVVAAACGLPWEVSIEGDLHGAEFVAEGDRLVVNGATLEGPFIVFRRPLLTGMGIVSIGADVGAVLKLGV